MRTAAAIAVAVAAVASARAARAYDFILDATTIGQAYQLRAGDDTLVNRRRLTQSLALEIMNLGPRDGTGRPLPRNQASLSVLMRFSSELADFAELPAFSGRTPERSLTRERLELLWAMACVEKLGGFLDLRLGRQIRVDLFELRAFDGLAVEVRTPIHVALEAWGGLAVSGAAPIDSPLYRADGVALGGNPRGGLAARQEEALQPTVGLSLRADGLPWLAARLSYQRTWSPTGEPRAGEPAWGTIEERVALTARAPLLGGRLAPWFAMRWGILVGRLEELQAGVRAALGRHAVSAEYVLSAPTFDGDSIWNVFGGDAFDDARAGWDWAGGAVRVWARAFFRRFGGRALRADPTAAVPGGGEAYGGAGGLRVAGRRGFVRLDGYVETGFGGRKGGLDLAGRLRLLGRDPDGVTLDGRASYVFFADERLAPGRDPATHSLGLSLGLRWVFLRGVTFSLAVEENVNRWVGSQTRLMALLDVSFLVGTTGRGLLRGAGGAGWWP